MQERIESRVITLKERIILAIQLRLKENHFFRGIFYFIYNPVGHQPFNYLYQRLPPLSLPLLPSSITSMLNMRQRSPWKPQSSKTVAANPPELTQFLLLVRGLYEQHRCPRILPQRALRRLFIPRENLHLRGKTNLVEAPGREARQA